ncbi:MAG TPA: cytochrome c [Stellaceae bacterium]|nr:cytochrome c [Stellaceae bacterium]
MVLERELTAVLLAAVIEVLFSVGMARGAEITGNAAADPAQVERGRKIYSERCSHCHGLNMVTGGNATYDLREFPSDQSERFFESVTNGKNNRMPPWGDVISQEEIGDIWAYVLSRHKT